MALILAYRANAYLCIVLRYLHMLIDLFWAEFNSVFVN